MNADVLVLGDLNIDLALDVPEFPLPGGEGVASRQRIGFGGSAANTAVVLRQLGLSTALLACLGEDEWGTLAVSGISAVGVDTSLLQRSDRDGTSLNIVAVTPDGERTMLAYRGASSLLDPASVPGDLRGVRCLHLSGYALLAEPQRLAATTAATRARAVGVPVSLDVPVDLACSASPELLAFLPLVDILVIGADELHRLTGISDPEPSARAVARYGPGTVAVKQGAGGVVLLTGDDVTQAPAPRVDVVDSTGAGDSFCAGLVFALLRGAAPADAARLANACGAAAVATLGAGARLPGPVEVARVLGFFEPPARDRLLTLLSQQTLDTHPASGETRG